ncbi:hypothetical protein RRF57_012998 [Xylaria bambusicola]|uniref:Uncharacterized protein n=1 Tax=Xylaria bambusicola TaxID=326684 RepID=A0AAN7V176_9PEZI
MEPAVKNNDNPAIPQHPNPRFLMSTASKSSLVQSPISPPPMCICDAETQRFMSSLTQRPNYRSPEMSLMSSLPDMLKMAHALVQHWGDVNGCPNAGLHLDMRTLRTMTEAIGAVLSDYEIAVGLMLLSASTSSSPNCCLNSSDISTGVGEDNLPKAMIGELELELVERAIVVQQAVKHSVLRLAAVLQDIEEEAALATRSGEVESPLRDRCVQELSTRLFRLLGTVNQIGCTGAVD